MKHPRPKIRKKRNKRLRSQQSVIFSKTLCQSVWHMFYQRLWRKGCHGLLSPMIKFVKSLFPQQEQV